jgi:arylsulfatase
MLSAAVPRDTYVIFTSDHGEMLGDHYLFRKCLPYDGSARIPLVMFGPGIEAGKVVDRPVGLEDIMPTLLELAGVAIPKSVDGESLLTGKREYLHGEHAWFYVAEQGNHFLTDGREKYVWFVESGREQLFDLVNDPRELHDISGRGVTKWRKRLIEKLRGRPEGFTDGKRLIAGRPYPAVVGG